MLHVDSPHRTHAEFLETSLLEPMQEGTIHVHRIYYIQCPKQQKDSQMRIPRHWLAAALALVEGNPQSSDQCNDDGGTIM